jgi:hypothetical protein
MYNSEIPHSTIEVQLQKQESIYDRQMSIYFPPDLVEKVKHVKGYDSFSRYVVKAVDKQLKEDQLKK